MIKENRTVAQYIKAKLGITAKKYCELQEMPYRTLAYGWQSDKERTHIINQVFMLYSEQRRPATVKRFDEL